MPRTPFSYGAIFQLDGVVLDLLPLKRALWGAVAAEFAPSPAAAAAAAAEAASALPAPDDNALKESNGLPPDEAIRKCFDWVNPVRDGSAAAAAAVEKYSLVHAQVQQRVFSKLAHIGDDDDGIAAPLGAVVAAPSPVSGGSRWEIAADFPSGSRGTGRRTESGGSEHIITRPPRRSAAATGVATSTLERPKTKNRWSADTTTDEQVAANVARALRHTQAVPGFTQWVDVLRSAAVPCAVVSSYPLATVRAALQAAGLWDDYFEVAPPPEPPAPAQADDDDGIGFGAFASSPSSSAGSSSIVTSRGFGNGQPVALVCAESGRGRIPQLYLGASLALERPPCKCAVFDCGPAAMMAAHEADMRGVAVRQSR